MIEPLSPSAERLGVEIQLLESSFFNPAKKLRLGVGLKTLGDAL